MAFERPECDFNIIEVPPDVTATNDSYQKRDKIISLSRSKYARAKSEVVEKLFVASEIIEQKKEVIVEIEEGKIILVEKEVKKPIPELIVREVKQAKREETKAHKYLQNFIKKMAESRGYKAVIEEPT